MDITIPYGKYKNGDIEELLKDAEYMKWIVDHKKDDSDFYKGVVENHYANLYEQPISGAHLNHRIDSAIKLRGIEFLQSRGFNMITKSAEYRLDDEFSWFIVILHSKNASIAGKFMSYFYRARWALMSGHDFEDSDVEAVLKKYEHVVYEHAPEHIKVVKRAYQDYGTGWNSQSPEIYAMSTCYAINRYGTHNTNHEEEINFLIPDGFKETYQRDVRDLFEDLLIDKELRDKAEDEGVHVYDLLGDVDANPNFIFNGIKAEIDVLYKDKIFIFKTLKHLDINAMELYAAACASIINKCNSEINVAFCYVIDLYGEEIHTIHFDNLDSDAILKTLEIV